MLTTSQNSQHIINWPKTKKRQIKKFDIKQLVIFFTEGGQHTIITQTFSLEYEGDNQNEKIIWFFNNINTNNVDWKSNSCAYPIRTKKNGI